MKILLLAFVTTLSFAKDPISGSRFEHLTGIKNFEDTQNIWDAKYRKSSFVYGKTPAKFLAENFSYIPSKSKVLDMGMGEGRNAVFLSQKGHQVIGVDISSVAVKKSHLLAAEFGVKIKGIVASLNEYKFQDGSFDAIVCFYYVDRSLSEKMKKWLKPGGILIFEAHTLREKKQNPKYKNDKESYFLKDRELLKLFPGFRILKYEEPLHEKEFRSSIILQK